MRVMAFAAGVALSLAPQAATAQSSDNAAADALGNCLARKSTGEDRLVFAGWMVAALASAPQLAGVANVDPSTKAALDRQLAAIFTRLMTVDCAAEARPLFQARDNEGMRIAGGALGRIAMQEISGDPAASEALEAFTKYLRGEDFVSLMK